MHWWTRRAPPHGCLLEEKLYKHSQASMQWQKHSSSSSHFHNMVVVSVSTHLQEKKTTLSVQHVIYIPQPMSMCRGNVGSANKVSHTGGVTGTWWCTKEEVLVTTAAATLNLQVQMLTCMTEELEKNTKSLSHSKLSNFKSGLLQIFQNRFKPKIAATWGTITAYRRRDCCCFLLQSCALQWEMLWEDSHAAEPAHHPPVLFKSIIIISTIQFSSKTRNQNKASSHHKKKQETQRW